MRQGEGAIKPGTTASGIGLGVIAYAVFTVHDAAIKWIVASLPIWQVLMVRSVVIIALSLSLGRGRLVERAIATPLKAALLFRGAITLTAWLCYYSASRRLPLGQMMSIYFAAPIIVTLMAGPLLGETVGRWRWLCVLVGFTGVMAASDPFGVTFSSAAVLVLIAAGLWGYGIILMRQIARRESSLLQMLYSNSFFLAGTTVGTVLTWQTPTLHQGLLLASVGGLGALGQFCLFEAARRAPAAVMATVEYTALLWAFALGFAIWGDIPRPAVWLGAGLIVLAGLLLVGGERRLRTQEIPEQT